MFERFTEGSRTVLVEAHHLAADLGSSYVGVAHLLYGCADGREETAGGPLRDCGITSAYVRGRLPRRTDQRSTTIDPDALRAIGIDFDGVRAAVEALFGPGALDDAADRRSSTGRVRKPPFSPQAKRAIEHSLRVALELHHCSIVPGHLLLALLRLADDFVLSALDESGTTVAELSAAVLTQVSLAARHGSIVRRGRARQLPSTPWTSGHTSARPED